MIVMAAEVAFAAAVFGAVAAPARASCVSQSFDDSIARVNGNAAAPTNLVIIAPPFTVVGNPPVDVLARDGAGNEVAFDVATDDDGMLRFTPATPLAPRTAYNLFCIGGRSPRPDDDITPCAAITTGDGADEEPPATAVVTDHSVRGVYDPFDRECSGPVDFTVARFEMATPPADIAAAVLRRTLDGALTTVDADAALSRPVLTLSDGAEEGGDASYDVVLVDDGGNESEPVTFAVPLGCPGSCAQADTGLFAAPMCVASLWRRRARRRPDREPAP